MKFFAKSDIGITRQENQDSYGITEAEGEYLLAVVCDGMGGVVGGKTAAKLAVKTYLERFSFFYSERRDATDSLTSFDIRRIFSNSVYSANKAVCEKSESEEALRGMGTTLTSAMIYKNSLYTANVGDSRIYLIRGEEITQITKDNSYVQELLDKGLIDEQEARCHPRRNLITKALGVASEVEPDFSSLTLEEGDVILLCSDGLTNALSDEEIASVINEKDSLEEKGKRIIDKANQKDGEDNVTVVLIKI